MNVTTTTYVYVSAESTVALLSILFNTLVLVVIKRYCVFSGSTNYFISNLAVADLLVGIFLIPTVVLPYAGLPREFHSCIFLNSVVVILTNSSILNIDAIAMERYVAVLMYKQRHKKCTRRSAGVVIVLCWVLAILFGVIPNMGWHLDRDIFVTKNKGRCGFTVVIDLSYMVYVIFFGLVTPSILFAFFIYYSIFRFVHKHLKSSLLGQSDTRKKMELQATRALFRVVVVFAVCWLPMSLNNTVFVFFPDVATKIPPEVVLSVIVLSHANSFMNPIIYAYSSQRFKQALQHLLWNKLFVTAVADTHVPVGKRTLAAPDVTALDVRDSNVVHVDSCLDPSDPCGLSRVDFPRETLEPQE